MKTKILDFRMFLTVTLVVVCFFGDRFSTLEQRKAGIQNLTFVTGDDIKDEAESVDCTSYITSLNTDIHSFYFDKETIKHFSIRVVKE